jgi:hypothetical protein
VLLGHPRCRRTNAFVVEDDAKKTVCATTNAITNADYPGSTFTL